MTRSRRILANLSLPKYFVFFKESNDGAWKMGSGVKGHGSIEKAEKLIKTMRKNNIGSIYKIVSGTDRTSTEKTLNKEERT